MVEDQNTKADAFLPILNEEKRLIDRCETKKNLPRVGVALSGGGIRSATISLGFFQALAKTGQLGIIHYLSTVSGGGYFGSFLGRFCCQQQSINAVEKKLSEPMCREVKCLRESGNYIAPRGAPDLLLAGSIVLRNWISLQVMLVVAAVSAFLCFHFVEHVMALFTYSVWLTGNDLLRMNVFLAAGVLWLVFVALPAGWSYWLVQKTVGARILAMIPPITIGVVSGWIWYINDDLRMGAVTIVMATTLATYVYSLVAVWNKNVTHIRAKQRAKLSRWLTACVLTVIVLFGIGLFQKIGSVLFSEQQDHGFWTFLSVIGSGLGASWAGRLVPTLTSADRGKGLKISLSLVSSLAAFLVVLLWLSLVSMLSCWLVDFLPEHITLERRVLLLGGITVCALLLVWIIGNIRSLANISSQHIFYRQRLIRAYLGSAARPMNMNVTQVSDSDDMDVTFCQEEGSYQPYANGGPLHIINCTLNETIQGDTKMQQPTSNGIGLAVGPGGISLGRKHHWRPNIDSRPVGHWVFNQEEKKQKTFSPETLTLGQWMAISGAAFSTGLGVKTNPGLSLLAGMANVRLGYWWDSALNPHQREGWRSSKKELSAPKYAGHLFSRVFPLFGLLSDELLARFHGSNRRYWYLSDGGHFENLAVYELIRRKLPTIICLDNGADPDYGFDDLGQLVRKARIDFGAEIRFLSEVELDGLLRDDRPGWCGELEELKRTQISGGVQAPARHAFSKANMALAQVTYADQSKGYLFYFKPSLLGNESADLINYHESHPDFPHQTTIDQFFDEAQWESYRRLGQSIGEKFTNWGGIRRATSI